MILTNPPRTGYSPQQRSTLDKLATHYGMVEIVRQNPYSMALVIELQVAGRLRTYTLGAGGGMLPENKIAPATH